LGCTVEFDAADTSGPPPEPGWVQDHTSERSARRWESCRRPPTRSRLARAPPGLAPGWSRPATSPDAPWSATGFRGPIPQGTAP